MSMNNLSNILKKVLLVGFLLLGTMAYAQTTYVVAVGLSNYKYPSLAPSLPCSVGDAKAISHFFHDYNGSKVFMLLNENATRDHILRVLKAQFAKSTVNDEIIFAFSGHGVQGGLTSYDIKDASGVISYNEIQSIMKASKARRKIIFAMACYSGGLTLKNGNAYKRNTEKTSVMLYTSSRSSEVSWEHKEGYVQFILLQAYTGSFPWCGRS